MRNYTYHMYYDGEYEGTVVSPTPEGAHALHELRRVEFLKKMPRAQAKREALLHKKGHKLTFRDLIAVLEHDFQQSVNRSSGPHRPRAHNRDQIEEAASFAHWNGMDRDRAQALIDEHTEELPSASIDIKYFDPDAKAKAEALDEYVAKNGLLLARLHPRFRRDRFEEPLLGEIIKAEADFLVPKTAR